MLIKTRKERIVERATSQALKVLYVENLFSKHQNRYKKRKKKQPIPMTSCKNLY